MADDNKPEAFLEDFIDRVLFLHYDPLESEAITTAHLHKRPEIIELMIGALEKRAGSLRKSKLELEGIIESGNADYSNSDVPNSPNSQVYCEADFNGKPSNGQVQWRTIRELVEEGSKFSRQELREVLKSGIPGLEVRQREGARGSPYEVLVTPKTRGALGFGENLELVGQEGIVGNIDSQDNCSPEPRTFELGGGRIEVYPDRSYDRIAFDEVLRRIGMGSFASPINARKLFVMYAGDSTQVSGESLIALIEDTKDMMPLNSKDTIKRLSELGLCEPDENPSNVRAMLIESPFRELVYALDGLESEAFLRRKDVPEIKEKIGLKRRRILTSFHNRFSNNNIMPVGKSYDALISAGVFNDSSLTAIMNSYSAYEAAMNGWEIFPGLVSFVRELPNGWEGFNLLLPRLKERGLLKDVVEELGTSSHLGRRRQPKFYAVAKGKKGELYEFAGVRTTNQ